MLSKKMIIMYAAVLLTLFGVFYIGGNFGEAVFTNSSGGSEIPIYSVEVPEKKVAITFDAAWGDEDTDELIKILGQNSAKASFFVVGGWVDRFPQSVKKFHEAGHEILNHSDTHSHMANLSENQIKTEITECEKKISDITGTQKKLFRPPYGEYNDKVIKSAKDIGFLTIQWDVDSLDWKDLAIDEIANRVTGKVKNGSIILFHNGAKNTPEALKIILPKLAEKGYKFVSVSELIYKDNYKIDIKGRQSQVSNGG